MPVRRAPEEGEDEVPIFGTWARIYVAVVVCAVLVMGAVALFQGTRW